jgi:hypothetical protein
MQPQEIRNVSVYTLPVAFRWPQVGEIIMVVQMNSTWYIEGYAPDTNTFWNFDPGDAILTTPTGVVHVTTDGQGTDYVIDPTGQVILYASTVPPSGYLACNGAAVSRTTYANLFAVTGTTYGPGDGSTTFNLPNLSPLSGVQYIIKT